MIKPIQQNLVLSFYLLAVLHYCAGRLNDESLSKTTGQDGDNNDSAHLDRQAMSEFEGYTLERVQIGEDCNLPNNDCKYFRPVEFAQNQPNFIREAGLMWTEHEEAESDLNVLDGEICKEYGLWLTEMYHLQCVEEGLEESSQFCRRPDAPTNVNPVDNPRMYLMQNMTFKHVRKAGGNTITNFGIYDIVTHETPNFKLNIINSHEGDDMVHEHMRNVELQQQKQREGLGYGHPIIAVVRNPVHRFISAISEILKNQEEVRNACYNEAMGPVARRRSVIKCVLKQLQKRELRDVHVVPMFADLYCNLMGHDVEVSLYDVSSLPRLLQSFNANPETNDNRGQFGLSLKDLRDDGLLEYICRKYAWDVAMMEYAGFEVPECRESFTIKTKS